LAALAQVLAVAACWSQSKERSA